MKMSLDHDNYLLYCCPTGEIGQLCQFDWKSKTKCSYCWFVRCELDGLIERWQVCNGSTKSWSDILKHLEYDSSEEGT